MEGRKCSGRPRALSSDVQRRFIEMVKASCDAEDPGFIYITRKARVITAYRRFLAEEFQKDISIHALRRLVRKESLDLYLKQPDFDADQVDKGYFNPEEVFDLISPASDRQNTRFTWNRATAVCITSKYVSSRDLKTESPKPSPALSSRAIGKSR